MTTRAELTALIQSRFPQNSMANVTNAQLQEILLLMLTDGGNPHQSTVTAAAAEAAGNTISADAEYVIVTSGNADHFVVLPPIADVSPGKRIMIEAGATGFELRTPASSNTRINNVDSDSAEAAIPATGLAIVTAVSAAATSGGAGWLLMYLTELGAVATAIVPD